jgi:hypothetical protein
MITWRSLQKQLPTMALCVALAMVVSIPAVLFAPHRTHAQSSATFLANWQYVETRDTFAINPPLTVLQLKNPPAVDATGALLYPVLVYLGNSTAADGLLAPGNYTVSGQIITFTPMPFSVLPPSVVNASEAQVVYVYAPTDAALAAAATANAAAVAAAAAKQ